MNVLMLSQEVHPIPPVKGAAVEQWIDAVARRCVRYRPLVVSVPHPERPDEETDGNVTYRRIRMGRVYKRLFRKLTRLDPWSYCDRIVAFARPHAPAIVHIHNAPQFVDALHRGLPGARIVLHMHNEKATRCASRVDVLIGCSRYIKEWFHADEGIPAARYGVLPNGVDTLRFTPVATAVRSELRARLGLPDDRVLVLYSGRISPEKGPDLLVDAFKELDPARFHMVLAGEWPKGDPVASQRVAFAESLRSRCRGLPLTVLGALAPEAMVDVYRAADLLVVPSRFEEPFSMAAIEAMACGVPVLALAKGGMVEYMKSGENAILLPASTDSGALAEAIRRLAGDASLREQLGVAGRALVLAKFDWARVAEETERLYGELLAGGEHG